MDAILHREIAAALLLFLSAAPAGWLLRHALDNAFSFLFERWLSRLTGKSSKPASARPIFVSMTFDEIQRSVLTSSRGDWHQVDDGSGYERFMFKPDPRVALSIGRQQKNETRTERRFFMAWASAHPDSAAYELDAEIEFHGCVIDVWRCVSVDGGRALIPYPELSHGDPLHHDENSKWGWTLSTEAFQRGQILGKLYVGRFEEYVQRSGLGVEGRSDFEVRLYDSYAGELSS